MNMKTYLASSALILFLLGCSSSGREADTNQQQAAEQTTSATSAPSTTAGATSAKFVTYDAAIAKAKAENKFVFVDIYTDWCTWCQRLDKDVYSNATVQQAFAKNFAITKINAESATEHTFQGATKTEEQIATSWNVTGFPTLVFLDTTEKPVFAYIGYLPPDKFLKLLDFVSSGAFHQTDDFNTWLKTHSS